MQVYLSCQEYSILVLSTTVCMAGLVQRALYGLAFGVATIFSYLPQLGVAWWSYHSLAITSALHGDWTLASFGLLAVWSEICALVAAVYTLSHIGPLKGMQLWLVQPLASSSALQI